MKNVLQWFAVFFFAPTLSVAGPILYGVSSAGVDAVYTINTTTGAATLVTPFASQTASLVGAEFLDGDLWVSDVATPGWTTGTVNLATGAFTPVSTQAGSSNWHALAAIESTDTFYSVSTDRLGSPLYSMTKTGTTTLIGNTGQGIVGLAYNDSASVLYGVTGTQLFTLNTTTGAATAVGSLGFATNGTIGLAYSDVLGTLFLNTGGRLYSVNTSTGAATLIGLNGVSGVIDGLAIDETGGIAAVPEPMSLVLLGTGVAGLAARRARKRRSL